MEEENCLKVRVVVSENPGIDRSFLEEERKALGPFVFQQEYEGEFVASDTSNDRRREAKSGGIGGISDKRIWILILSLIG
jgi:hypothetical protein